MDYTVHGVAKTWTQLSDFHFFLLFNLILHLWLAVVLHAVVGLQTRVCPAVISGHALKSSACAELCPTLCAPMDGSPPGSSVLGILQARILDGLPFPSPGDLPNPGIEPASSTSPVLQADYWPGKLQRYSRALECQGIQFYNQWLPQYFIGEILKYMLANVEFEMHIVFM